MELFVLQTFNFIQRSKHFLYLMFPINQWFHKPFSEMQKVWLSVHILQEYVLTLF